MATSRRKKSTKGLVWQVAALVLVLGFVFSWASKNNITSVQSAINYIQGASNEVADCTREKGLWFACYGNKGISLKPKDVRLPNPSDVLVPGLPKLDQLKNLKTPADILPSVKTADPVKSGYNRREWKHWSIQSNGCTTRENTLLKQGQKISKKGKCKVVSGEWVDPFTGDKMSEPGKIDIDHVVPLGYAAEHGGNSWSAAKKEKFANDPVHLLAVSAKENRSKGAKGPSQYMPPNKAYHCEYAKIWSNTTVKYGLTVAPSDKKAIEKGLKTC